MVGLTPEEFFRMYKDKLEPEVARQFEKLLEELHTHRYGRCRNGCALDD